MPSNELVHVTNMRSDTLERAPEAWVLASKIASTEFVPKALRDKPEAVLACILAGHEAGVGPMQALAKIHVIEGRPAMAAELMRAIVLAHGHELIFEEKSTTAVTVAGKRTGSAKWSKITWTMDDARAAGLASKDVWKKYPRNMLAARATAELCRDLFPDLLAGLSYSLEELTDGDLADAIDIGDITPDPAPAAHKAPTTSKRAARAITRTEQKADAPDTPPPAERGDVPDLPDEPEFHITAEEQAAYDDSDIVDAEVVEPDEAPDVWPEGGWDDTAPPPATGEGSRLTGPQRIAMLMADKLGIKGNDDATRHQRLKAIADILNIDTPSSSKDLTADQLGTVIAYLAELPEIADLVQEHDPSGAGASAQADEPATSEPASDAVTPPAAASPAPEDQLADRRRRRTIPPDEWSADDWRKFLNARKVKVTEALRRANELGAEADPAATYPTVDDLAGAPISADLMGWVEDTSLERSKT